ncbi:MAG TPA: OmpA family protein [Rhizomicrobium sp.]|nr:OmpA family protein [Rhizomicrobium sp.]
MTKHYARPLAKLTIVLGLATVASGCQTVSDLDPTGLLGDDEQIAETQFPTDSEQQAQADANTTTPDLAGIPTRPPAPDTVAQADAAQSVTAAGAQAQYSAEALRAGTEASAPPPVAADVAAARQALAASDTPPTASAADVPPSAGSASANDEPPTASAPPPSNAAVPARVASAALPPPTAAPNAAPPPTAAPTAAPPVTAPMTSVAPPDAPPVASSAPPVASAPVAPPPGAEPAVPPNTRTASGMTNPTDAQLGFKPSAAPPLNSSISKWVSPPILAHYRQTAAAAGSAGTAIPAVPAVAPAGRGRAASGDVVANMNAVPGTPAGMAAAMNGGVPPVATVYFSGDRTTLPASARNQVREAVAVFRANGGTGSIKVVGHASSRTANMSVERHLEVIFQKSQARANAVAQALIRAGVPADKVIVEAVGDSQPIYYESMPKGEAGNRRAEIFVQG